MAFVNHLREKSGFASGVILLLVLLFVGLQGIGGVSYLLMQQRKAYVGKVAGKEVTIPYYQRCVQASKQYCAPLQGKLPPAQYDQFVQQQAWELAVSGYIQEHLYKKQFEDIGFKVTDEELVDMVQGDRIDARIRSSWTDVKTGVFDKEKLVSWLQELGNTPQAKAWWAQQERTLVSRRLDQKVAQLLEKSVLTPDIEMQHNHKWDNVKLDIRYLSIPFDSVPEAAITVTDSSLMAYMKKHKDKYTIPVSRDVQYVTFPVRPSAMDKALLKDELATLRKELRNAKDPVSFAKQNSDVPTTTGTDTLQKEDLPAHAVHRVGAVIGPVEEVPGSVYKLYRILSIKAGSPKQYEVAVIEKQLEAGDAAREEAFGQANDFANQVERPSHFEKVAREENLTLHQASRVKIDAPGLGTALPYARQLVKWLHDSSAKKEVSPVLEVDNQYLVAVMTQHHDKGFVPLEEVRAELLPLAKVEAKKTHILGKLGATATDSLDTLAKNYGPGARIREAKKVTPSALRLADMGLAAQALGKALTCPVGQRTPAITTENGVVMIEVSHRHFPDEKAGITASHRIHRKPPTQQAPWRQSENLHMALKELAKVEDLRYRFY